MRKAHFQQNFRCDWQKDEWEGSILGCLWRRRQNRWERRHRWPTVPPPINNNPHTAVPLDMADNSAGVKDGNWVSKGDTKQAYQLPLSTNNFKRPWLTQVWRLDSTLDHWNSSDMYSKHTQKNWMIRYQLCGTKLTHERAHWLHDMGYPLHDMAWLFE